MDEISVSGRYGITSEETYNTLLSFIKSLLLCTIFKTHKITKIYADCLEYLNFARFLSHHDHSH